MDILCPSLTLMILASAVESCVRVKTPVHKGTDVNQCIPCAALSEEQWTHLMENFAKTSAYRNRTGFQENSFEDLDTNEPVFTGKDLSRLDDTIHDLEPEHSSSTAPVTNISPLTSLQAPHPGSSQDIPASSVVSGPGPVLPEHGDSLAFLKAPTLVPQMVTQDTLPPQVPHTSRGHSVTDRMASLSFPQPPRTSSLMVPEIPRTQMIKSHLEEQNFELMKHLQ